MLKCDETGVECTNWRTSRGPGLRRHGTSGLERGEETPRQLRARAACKLFGNLAFLGLSALAGDIVRLADATSVVPQDAVKMFQQFNPGQFFPARFAKVAESPFERASFTVSLARKNVRLMVEEAADHGYPLVVMPAVAAQYDAAIARGEPAMDSSAAFRHIAK